MAESKLTDNQSVELLNALEERSCLWRSGSSWTRRERLKASGELCEVSTELDIRIHEEDSALAENIDG